MKFVLEHLPGRVSFDEISEMINTVDKNGDEKISFSEFRYKFVNLYILILAFQCARCAPANLGRIVLHFIFTI